MPTEKSPRTFLSSSQIVRASSGHHQRQARLLGEPYGSPESHENYERLLGEWRVHASHQPAASAVPPSDFSVGGSITINELIPAFWQHVIRTVEPIV